MLWSSMVLIGFLVLMAFVVALGTLSTGRYEREQRAKAGQASRALAEPGGVPRIAGDRPA